MEQEFPAGILFPTTLLVESEDGRGYGRGRCHRGTAVEEVDGAFETLPTRQLSDGRRLSTTVNVILEDDPFTKDALNVVPDMRDAVTPRRLTVLVGGGSAIQYDFDEAIESDLRLIAPIALLVIGLILAILLRSLVAPLVLIASVDPELLCTLGLSVLFIRFVVGDAGSTPRFPPSRSSSWSRSASTTRSS